MDRVLVYGMTSNPGGIESYLMNILKFKSDCHIEFDFVTDFQTIAYEEQIKKNGGKIYNIPAKGKNLFQHWKALKKF